MKFMNRKQFVLDVVEHLQKQGVKAGEMRTPTYDLLGKKIFTCLYRGPDNTKCAIGGLMPDEVYHPGFEGCTADGIMRIKRKTQPTEEQLSPEFAEKAKAFETYLQKTYDFDYDTDHAFIGCVQQTLHDGCPVEDFPPTKHLAFQMLERTGYTL